jgi:hypothetical protein
LNIIATIENPDKAYIIEELAKLPQIDQYPPPVTQINDKTKQTHDNFIANGTIFY